MRTFERWATHCFEWNTRNWWHCFGSYLKKLLHKGLLKGSIRLAKFPAKNTFSSCFIFSTKEEVWDLPEKFWIKILSKTHEATSPGRRRYDIFYTIYIKKPFYKRGCGGSWDANWVNDLLLNGELFLDIFLPAVFD